MLNPNLKVCYSLECEPEDWPIRGNAMCSGDDAEDRAVEDAIIADLESGNPWAWCCVKASCWVGGMEDVVGEDYLGGCSFASEEDFKASGCWDDMKEEARLNLMGELERHGYTLEI